MSERRTAEDRLHRLLHVLAAASRDQGVPLRSLASELGVSEREVLRDIGEATEATFHRPAGSVDPFTIMIEAGDAGGVVHVHTTGEFRRPTRLTPHESLALVLGLRAMAAEVVPDQRDAVLRLANGMETELGSEVVQAGDSASRDRTIPTASRAHESGDPAGGSDADLDAGAEGDPDAVLAAAAARHRCCSIRYVKPGGDPENRTIEPWRLIHAEGRWYVLARDPRETTGEDVRLFRCDRVLDARILEDRTFEVPADFDVGEHLPGGIAFAAAAPESVVVHYEQPAARWVAEAAVEPPPDDGLSLTHEVADRTWLVRHVLGFGGAATVIAPDDVRAEVARRARRVADIHDPGS